MITWDVFLLYKRKPSARPFPSQLKRTKKKAGYPKDWSSNPDHLTPVFLYKKVRQPAASLTLPCHRKRNSNPARAVSRERKSWPCWDSTSRTAKMNKKMMKMKLSRRRRKTFGAIKPWTISSINAPFKPNSLN